MSGEKTEKATPKKRREARKEGQVLKSTEVTTAFCAIVMFSLMLIILQRYLDQLAGLFTGFLGSAVTSAAGEELSVTVVQGIFQQMIFSFFEILLPIVLCALLSGIFINIVQVGFLFTSKPLMPKLSRISPLSGFKRMFSVRTLTELVKSFCKIIVLGYIVYSEYMRLLPTFPAFMTLGLYKAFIEILSTAFSIAIKMCVALAIIAILDYLFQWWKHEKDMKMSKQDIKDEYKLAEGDPKIKGKIKQKQRQMSAMRMMERVPSADVVITNPTHYAVALKYEDGVSRAPVVVAKGQDFIARKIKETAREYDVEIVENKPLAQALFNLCEIGDEIPEEFYKAVADILVYVYKQKKPEYLRRRVRRANI